MLIRGIGPTLADIDSTLTPIPDPNMEMFSGMVLIDESNDYFFEGSRDEIFDTGVGLGVPSLDNVREASLLRPVASGAYTVHVTDRTGTVGDALIEAYDADVLADSSRVINFSTRARVGGSAGILEAAFTIEGSSSMRLLIRGVGPSLERFSVLGPISDPGLRVLDNDGQEVGGNDDWSSGDAVETELVTIASQVGAFALDDNSLDAALLITLEPGVYTAIVEDARNPVVSGTSSGIALVEIYEVR